MKRLILLALAMIAVWMAGRAVRRARGELDGQARLMAALWSVLAMSVQLNSPANTAKTRAIEDRLNALVPQVFPNTGGTITGNVNVTGVHSASQVQAGGASGSASITGTSAHFTANTQTDGTHTASQVLAGGASGSASVAGTSNHFTGNTQTDGNHSVGGGLSAGNVSSSGGATNEFTGAIHTGGNAQVDGQTSTSTLYVSGQRIAPGQGTPGGYPMVSTTPWGPGVVAVINGIITSLHGSGILV
jgi:hypothetical protein